MPKVVPALCAAFALLAAAVPARADEFRLLSYARLGRAAVFDSKSPRREPGMGFGVRGGTDTFAIDVSFLNFVLGFHPVDEVRDMSAGSMLKIEGLRYLSPRAQSSAYVGGGMSWGHLSLGRSAPPGEGATSWGGHGLQAEFTAGFELARKSPVRLFVQADATAPLFRAASETYDYSQPGRLVTTGTETLYAPTVVVSFGVGWHRSR
jgi:hypothetical protein